MAKVLSDERTVERDDLAETFSDLVFSVEVTKDHVHIQLGMNRIDHRSAPPVKISVPTARLILPHRTTKQLVEALQAAVDAMSKVRNDDDRVAIIVGRQTRH